jgi:hypothetical protein
MTSHKQPAARLSEFAATLPGLIESLEVERLELERQMAALETLGLIYANPHWRDQKYLTLLYPMQPGEPRRRDYVGKDPQKVEDALQAVQRAKDYDQLAARAKRLQEAAIEGCARLQSAISALTSWKTR